MSRQTYLLGTSAVARWQKPGVARVLDELSDRGMLAVCAAVEIEVVRSTRTAAEAERSRRLLRWFTWCPMPDEVWDRAIDVQVQAVRRGNHRALSMTDLLVAATVEGLEPMRRLPRAQWDHLLADDDTWRPERRSPVCVFTTEAEENRPNW